MDLLGENRKKQKTANQKLVLILLIISIVLLVLTVGLLAFFKYFKPKANELLKLKINGAEGKTSDTFIITLENGENYISLRELAQKMEYSYFNGEYLQFSEDKNKGYIDNGQEIIGFENGSKKIYKTKEGDKELQYYELSREIISSNNMLYVNINDIAPMLSLIVNNGSIDTTEKFVETLSTTIKEKGYTDVDADYNNLKAISYNLIIVNKDSRKGIVNLNFEEIVGTKYDTIEFIEYTMEFIVSSNNKYGILKQNGERKIDLVFDEIKILSYSPLLYSVKINNKFGILNKDGELIANTEYDKIGYDADNSKNIEETVIIPSLINEIKETVVVGKEQKYGLLDIEGRKLILDCTFDGIYKIKTQDTEKYVVKTNNQEYSLLDYLEYVKTKI